MNFLMVDPILASTDPESVRAAAAASESVEEQPPAFVMPEFAPAKKIGLGTLLIGGGLAWLLLKK